MTQWSCKKAEDKGKTVAPGVSHVQPHFWQQPSLWKSLRAHAQVQRQVITVLEEPQPKLHTENMALGFYQSSYETILAYKILETLSFQHLLSAIIL